MTRYSSLSTTEIVRLCSASGDVEAWEEFVRRFHRFIASVVLRTANRLGDFTRQSADDLIQETYLKLCADNFRLLRNFMERNPEAFIGYVKVVAANVVRDHFKAMHSLKRGPNQLLEMDDSIAVSGADLHAGSQKNMERQLLIQEIDRYLEQCTTGADQARNRNVFWLYYRAGLSASAIAALPEVNLTTKGVESVVLRITRDLRHRIVTPTQDQTALREKPSEGICPA